jgi:hypothetical protein
MHQKTLSGPWSMRHVLLILPLNAKMEDVLVNMMNVSNIRGQGSISLTLLQFRILLSGEYNRNSRLTLIFHARFFVSMVVAEKKLKIVL